MRRASPILTAVVVVLVLACCSPHLLPALYLELAGMLAPGTVTGKQEAYAMFGEDRVRHTLEVSYRFTPLWSSAAETSAHQVDATLYDRLHVGDRVAVLYNPAPFIRGLHIVAMGSVLADSTWASRIPSETETLRTTLDIGAMVLAGLLGFVAWKRKTRGWTLAASFVGATVCSAVVPLGFVAFPVLAAKWWKSRGEGYGWALAASLLLTAPILYWRVPKPPAEPSGQTRTAAAIVKNVSRADTIWAGYHESGQSIPQPFQMADLEFTPDGAREPVHALDRVDLDSVSGLREGAALRVVYPVDDPRAARLDGGTRTYAERAVIYLMEMTFGIAAVLVFVVLPLVSLFDRGVKRVGKLLEVPDLSKLPPDDPRRQKLEELLRRRANS